MADLVVGISRTAVQLLAEKVKSAIKEEAEQWKIVQRDLVFITGEFEMMQSFLDTASNQRVKNLIVRTWVRQVRDLSYDVEDCIEFVLHLDSTKRSWWLRLLPSCSGGKMGAERPVDQAVNETTLLRARVVDVSQRNIRYNLIVDSASKPMAAMDPLQKVASSSTSSFDILINAVKKAGPLDLTGLITREDTDLHVVSVCGTDVDHVKIAIVRKMYSDARIHKEFQCRGWVKLVHPFNPHEFLRSLMIQFLTHSCREQEVIVGLDALARMQATQGDLDLINEFAQTINTHRYLIVLEDLCTMVQWDAIRSCLPDRKKGSRIVVLTHHPVVASQCTGEPCRFSELGQFSQAGHNVRVYYKEGFQHDRVISFIMTQPYHSFFNYGLLGRDADIEELFKQTQKTQESGLICVCGMLGVGKSALVETIYGKLRMSDEFKRQAWVCVSRPFNSSDFCRSLLVGMQIESTSVEGKYGKALQAEDPVKECQDHLCGCLCLLIIDDVQSNEDWDWIKSNLIQYTDSKSCIIAITSEDCVAIHCVGSSINGVYVNVEGLNATDTVELFQKALEMEEGEKTSTEKDAEILLSKCGGLPGVITTVAGYLASKPRDQLGYQMRCLSENFMKEVATNPWFESLQGLLAWMHCYLDACPPHLKKCMLYLAIFPQDIIIQWKRLIRRWIAEGYSKGTDSESMEEYAEKIFDEVAALSVMQQVWEAGNMIGYRVNGFFREYVLSRPAEERIFFPVEVSALGVGHGRFNTEGIGQHLSIVIGTDSVYFRSLDVSRLRSLTVFRDFWALFVLDSMRALRVLDLENAGSGYANHRPFGFEEIGKLPSHLKFLSLRGQREICTLPDFMGDLVQLQTLDIRDTSVVSLPPFITKLRKLQHILAGSTIAWAGDHSDTIAAAAEEQLMPSRSLASCLPMLRNRGPVISSGSGAGVGLPRGISRLEALRTLGAVDINATDDLLYLNLEFLLQLNKLKVCGINRTSRCRHFLSNLHELLLLDSLSLQFGKNNNFVDWDSMRLPRGLLSLKMYGHVEKLPVGIKDHNGLVKLTFEMTTLFTAGVVEVLGSIPELQTLRLRVNKDQDGELQFPNNYLFRKLQFLEIACKSKLHVRIDEGAMQKLLKLTVHCLQGSEIQFSGLEHPVSLKEVWLLRYSDDALKESVQQQLAKHPKKPSLKLGLEPRSSQVSRS